MEKSENPVRTYDTLEQDQKVRAILGAVMEPVSKKFALELSGVDYANLDDDEREKVDAVFGEEGIETSEDESTKYRLNDSGREKLEKSVDMKSVHKQIADNLMGSLGLDL